VSKPARADIVEKQKAGRRTAIAQFELSPLNEVKLMHNL
jgi:hypothetical protein